MNARSVPVLRALSRALTSPRIGPISWSAHPGCLFREKSPYRTLSCTAYRLADKAQPPDTGSSRSLPVREAGARVQHRAPNFRGTAVLDGNFKKIQLSDFEGKYLILLFYPLDFTFVCPTEIIAFSDRAEDFRALNTEVIAISTDSHFSHLAWTNLPRKEGGLGSMKIALLSDFSKQISRDYGVLIEDEGIALRGMFLIDPQSILRQVTINDLPVGRSVDEALRLVQAFQFVEKHGEVCPAGWLPKSDTIKPDPVKSKEYFRKQSEKQA